MARPNTLAAAFVLFALVPLAAHTATPDPAPRQRMLIAYAKARHAFPAALQSQLTAGQSTFLSAIQALCASPGSGPEAACLDRAYLDRAGDLTDALPRGDAYGRRFVAMKTYAQSGDTNVLVQIANPRTAAERRWNVVAVKAAADFSARFRNDPGQAPANAHNEYRFLIEATGPDFIESILSWRGGARWGVSRPLHWSLRLNRPLAASDLFADPAAAFNIIARLARADIDAQARTDPTLPSRIPPMDEIHARVADISNWNFSQDQLWIYTDPVPPDLITTLLPWTRITPLLRKDAPLAPRQLRWLN